MGTVKPASLNDKDRAALAKLSRKPSTKDQERAAGTRTIQEATRIASKSGKVLAIKQFSRHPDDDYLYLVLVEMPQTEPPMPHLVTMLVNTSCPGCHEGHYFLGVHEATGDFNNRGRL